MRVLYISESWSAHDERFVRLLIDARYEVGYVRLRGETKPGVTQDGLPSQIWWRDLQPRAHDSTPRLAAAVEDAMNSFAPNLVQAGPMDQGTFFAALTGFHPLVGVSWGSDVLLHAKTSRAIRELVAYALARSSALLCDCKAVQVELEAYPGPKPRFVRFPWGIEQPAWDPRSARNRLRALYGLESSFVIISLRRWEPGYDVEVALDAAFVAMEKNPDIQLVLGGGGALHREISEKVKRSRMRNRVRVVGNLQQREMFEWFAASDLYLSCTPMDGSSITLMEAMANGLPVVVTDAGGNREWVSSGDNGWLVLEKDGAGFAQAILECAGMSQDTRHRIAETNRQAISQRGQWSTNSKGLLQLYEDLLGLREATVKSQSKQMSPEKTDADWMSP